MKIPKTTFGLNAVNSTNDIASLDFDTLLLDQRLRMVAGQANATGFFAILAMSVITFFFHHSMAHIISAFAVVITVFYLLRIWLARKILQTPTDLFIKQQWLYLFSLVVVLCGLLWGGLTAVLILQDVSGSAIFISFLIGGIVVSSFSTLAAIKDTYLLFTLGVLVPIAASFFFGDIENGFVLAVLTLMLSAFLIFMANVFSQYLDGWLRHGVEDKRQASRLDNEKHVSKQMLADLKVEIEQYKSEGVAAKSYCETLSGILSNLPGMVYRAVNDGRWTLTFISDGCENLMGQSSDLLLKKGQSKLTDILISDDLRLMAGFFRAVGPDDYFEYKYNLTTPLGEIKQVVERGRRVFDDSGHLIAIDGFVTDITEQFRLSREVSHLERHDNLTGIFNRRQFSKVVKSAVYQTAHNQSEHVLLYIDLDQFKIINDTFGHHAGDGLLQQVTTLLKNGLRDEDTISRLGGDEFGVFLKNCSEIDASMLAEKLRYEIESYAFSHNNRSIKLTVSIGVASTNSGKNSLEALLSAAEGASYAAKLHGQNRIHLYQADDNFLMTRDRHMYWALEIPEAINDGRMYLEWQNIVPVDSNASQVMWCEVLLRMLDREGNIIMPGTFLPAAEQYNQAVMIDTWVVKTVIEKLAQQPDDFDELALCFINLSGQSMGQAAFLDKVIELLKQNNVAASRLCFEITETAAIGDMTSALKMMDVLQGMGCRFALDDFGSGLSSFAYLRDFPAEFLKIDGSFVQGMVDDPVNRSIVSSINDIGHATGKQIIAEFVENDEILQQLCDMGVDYAQGFGISKPQSTPKVVESNAYRNSRLN